MHDKSKKKVFSFDIDGVIADTAENAVKLFNKRFKQHKKMTDLKNFFIIGDWLFKILKDRDLATKETISVWNDNNVLSKSKPLKGSKKVIKHILAQGHEVRFVTSRPNSTRPITMKWFEKWFPEIDTESIYISSDSLGLQRSFKSEAVKAIRSDVHFEDSIEHACDISEASPHTMIILVRQPWNYKTGGSNLPKSILIPRGSSVRRNLWASYLHYLNTLDK